MSTIMPLWPHQAQAIAFARKRRGTMLAMDMGTGKSRVAVELLDEWKLPAAIILSPRSVVGVWPKQFRLHSDSEWNVVVPSVKTPVAKRAAGAGLAVEQSITRERPTVLVVNYEASWRPEMARLLMHIANSHKTVLICDECHRLKAPKGRASVFASRLAERCEKVLNLTGTPMPHSPLDVYAQFRVHDPRTYGSSAHLFKLRYAVMGGFEGKQVVGMQREAELAERFSRSAFVVTKDQAGLDLPPTVHVEHPFTLSPKARRAYTILENDLILGVENSTVTPANALIKLLRLQQITSGYVNNDDGEPVEIAQDKREVLLERLEDLPQREPYVVFYRFTHDAQVIRDIAERLGRRYGEVSGQVKPGSPEYGLTEDSTMREDVDLIALQLQSGGVGIDLTRACYAGYYSLDFNLGNYDQTLARLDRPGQTRPVTYDHFIATDSKDETVYEALSTRRDVVTAVIEDAQKQAEDRRNGGSGRRAA